MRRALILAAVLASTAWLAPAKSGAEDGAGSWAVTGVAQSDVLHLRDVPSADSKSLARVPSNARGLKNLGCLRKEPGLNQWMRMTKEDRQLASTGWCRVEYQGQQGWVAWRFLKKDERAK